jgi:hypothetical protein
MSNVITDGPAPIIATPSTTATPSLGPLPSVATVLPQSIAIAGETRLNAAITAIDRFHRPSTILPSLVILNVFLILTHASHRLFDYQCEAIDDMGLGVVPSGIDLEIDNDGHPVIVYHDLESGFHDLKIARPVGGLSLSGNCGPLSPLMLHMWRCGTLEEGDLPHAEAYGGLSIALNANGEAAVAYRELFDPIINPEEGRLKVALEPISIFLDGFESGDTTRWAATTP